MYFKMRNYLLFCNKIEFCWLQLFPYVYWTVHHLDIWVKRDQLDVTCSIISLFNAQHVSDVNTSILRSLRLICWVISWVVLLWFDVCWCYFVVWLWWCGIRMQAEAPPQPKNNLCFQQCIEQHKKIFMHLRTLQCGQRCYHISGWDFSWTLGRKRKSYCLAP